LYPADSHRSTGSAVQDAGCAAVRGKRFNRCVLVSAGCGQVPSDPFVC
jgi:hypothetical protein